MSAGLTRLAAIVLAIAALRFAAGQPAADQSAGAPVDPSYQQAFEKWKAELVDDLKKNWLPLAGLFWLKPGTNSFGTDPANDIVLPNGSAPARAGSFEMQGGDVTAQFLPDARATIEGKPVTRAKLQPDTSGDRTVVELGSLRMHVIVRGQRTGIRVKDLNSAAVRDYRGPVFFPLDPAYRISATWVPSHGNRTVDVPNVLGDVTPTPVAGEVQFKLNGRELRLADLGGDPAKGLSFVFSDLTGKTDTYPGGRFLDTDPVVNGTVVLDFNRAYSPPCAVTPYATCPLAPKENRLNVAIPAGEKYDRVHGHH